MFPTAGSFSALPTIPRLSNLTPINARRFTNTPDRRPPLRTQTVKSPSTATKSTPQDHPQLSSSAPLVPPPNITPSTPWALPKNSPQKPTESASSLFIKPSSQKPTNKLKSPTIKPLPDTPTASQFKSASLPSAKPPPTSNHSSTDSPAHIPSSFSAPSFSSALLSPKTFTANARIMSVNKYKSAASAIPALITLLLIITPLAILIWGSYHNWPDYLPLPPSVSLATNQLLARTPLPKTPGILLYPMIHQISQIKSFKQHFQLSVISSQNQPQLTITMSGPVDISDQLKLHTNIASKPVNPSPDNQTSSLTSAQIIYQKGVASLIFDQISPDQYLHLESLNNRPINFIINPSHQTTEDQFQHTPGEFALTKIRNNKYQQLIKDYYSIVLERATLPESNQSYQPYTITTYLSKAEVVNLIKEAFSIYQESTPNPTIYQPALEKFYDQLEQIINPLDITIYLEPETLNLDKIHLIIMLNRIEYASQTVAQFPNSNTPQTTSLPKPKFTFTPDQITLDIKYTISDLNQPVQIPQLPSGELSSQINWSAIITHPLIQPLMPSGPLVQVDNTD